ncbi:MAG: ribosome biogenesis GTPase Der [Bacilli bacterium]
MKTVAIVGRPNVGKSTLFNKIAKKRISIVENKPGVTRDRIYTKCEHKNKQFHLVDTGGIDLGQGDFNADIKLQVELAINEADIIVFLIDGKADLNANDYYCRDMLLKSGKEVIVAVNKLDNPNDEMYMYNFYELGFDRLVAISSEHSINISGLLDEITKNILEKEKNNDDDTIRFALIGRPNAGKSSLINAILNENRVIVSDIAGTTRDSVDVPFNYEKQKFISIDTAGLRKKGRIYESTEKFSYLRSIRAIENADICVLVLDINEGICEQDKHIAGYALENNKALVIVCNKWDLIKNKSTKEYEKLIRAEFQFLTYVPVVFLSSLTKKRIHTLMPEIIKTYENYSKRIKTSVLNEVIVEAQLLTPPPSYKGRRLKIYFSSQTGIKPPTFTFSVNDKKLVHFSYERYLINKLRENFDFEGTKIVIKFKNKND